MKFRVRFNGELYEIWKGDRWMAFTRYQHIADLYREAA